MVNVTNLLYCLIVCFMQSTVAYTRNVLVAFGRALEQWFSSVRINRFTVVSKINQSTNNRLIDKVTYIMHFDTQCIQ